VEATLERTEAVRQLRESESRLAGIIESAMDAIITVDEDRRVLVFNAAAETAFGCPAAEVLGRPLDGLIPERFREVHREHVHAFGETGQITRSMGTTARQVTALRSNGEEFPCDASVSRVDVGGRKLLTVILRDVTERARAEAARRELEDKVRQAQKMEALGTLAGGIAHDFNNILSVVLMNAELARADLPESVESLDAILCAGERARDLVKRILAFSRKQPQKRTVMDLRPTLEEAGRFMRAVLPAGLDLRTASGTEVPRVRADPTDIHQIVINLCTNAWHAIDGGHGSIEVRLDGATMTTSDVVSDPELHPGPYAVLSVSDSGRGMDATTRERIFEPFFTTKEVGRGTGLGLSVVHGIVKQMGGAIDVRSEPGRGSRFRVFFPAADPTAEAASTGAGALDVALSRGKRVLFVDDEEQLARTAAHILERAGFQVAWLARAEDALQAFRAAPDDFHVVVADVNMPGMSGLELAREVRRLRPLVPLLPTTGNRTQDLEAEAAKLGVQFLLEKPYSTIGLREAVAALASGANR
jgi:PAS domain S-box-containing protein